MRTPLLLLALSCISLFAAELDPRLAPMAENYKKQLKVITDQGVAKKSAAMDAFLAELKGAEAKAAKANKPGDVKVLAAITKEISDIESVVVVPLPPVDLPKLLQARHKALYKTFEDTDSLAAKQKAELDTRYLAALSNLQPGPADAALTAQIAEQKKSVLSGNFGPIRDLQTQLAGTRWQVINKPSEFMVFNKDGTFKYWKYTTPDADTLVVHWNENSRAVWKLGKDGKTLLMAGQPDLRLAPPAPEEK